MDQQRGFGAFASLYEQMVDWGRRLKREMPFYRSLVERYGVKRVLDAGCGVGRHAVALAEMGLEVTGTDIEKGMVGAARTYARKRGVRANFLEADFLSLVRKVPGPFDMVLCVGNSLPALRNARERVQALEEFARVLVPGGVLVLHVLNYAHLLDAGNDAMMTTMRSSTDGRVRFVKSFRPAGDHVELCIGYKEKDGPGGRFVHELYPVGAQELARELARSGFKVEQTLGDYDEGAFDERKSEDLIMVATRPNRDRGTS